MMASDFTIHLLADRPDLAGKWAELHWREWGDEPGREELSWWVANASQAVQRTQVPLAVIAVGPDDNVLGGIGIDQVWVATGGPAVRFYQQCGWGPVEQLLTQWGEMSTILTKHLSSTAGAFHNPKARRAAHSELPACHSTWPKIT
jgi:hypothetical protein